MFSPAAAVTLLLVLSYSTKEVDSFASVGGVITPPSWEELSHTLSTQSSAAADSSRKPLVTLYRDTNGWCPFCERVWLILRAKDIPYDEQLIPLQNKPDWYKALVPTTLVPAVLFHDEDTEKNERRIVWESSDIIKALDDQFPDTPRMIPDDNSLEYDAAIQMNEELSMAGFQFVYAGRNDTLSEADKLERKDKFIAELDRLDIALKKVHQSSGGRPCFRLGEEFTAIDAIMIPTLERWRYQLPLTANINILEGRDGIKQWFETMDSYEPYYGRVMGDEYSWTATNSMFLRYFGGGEEKPEIAEAILRADDAANRLTDSFIENGLKDENKVYSKEAAAKLVANHEAIVKDCTNEDPQSQKHIERASNVDAADAMLRHVCNLLLSNDDTIHESVESLQMGNAKNAASAARVVASRLCVPRDMSKDIESYIVHGCEKN